MMSAVALVKIGQFLKETAYLWQQRPFWGEKLAWVPRHQALYHALLDLDDAQFNQIINGAAFRDEWFSAYIPEVIAELKALTVIQRLQATELKLNRFAKVGIAGNKYQQIEAFLGCLNQRQLPVVEWCAGKGHLGRLQEQVSGVSGASLEYNKSLVTQGEALAAAHQLKQAFYHCDVLKGIPEHLNRFDHLHVGLHACGILHHRLLENATQAKVSQVAIAPCCFHKIPDDSYQALSELGQQSGLRLSISDLKLPQENLVTGGQRAHRLRLKEQIWRLAFSALENTVRGDDVYHPLPSIQKSMLNNNFESFCQWGASLHSFKLPPALDFNVFLRLGESTRARIARLDLLRHLFRRVLEYWLLLDKVHYMVQNGYRVEYGYFCDYTLTPRNLMLIAKS